MQNNKSNSKIDFIYLEIHSAKKATRDGHIQISGGTESNPNHIFWIENFESYIW